MTVAPSPDEIYQAAGQEGRRRLYMPPLEQIATGFIAGMTIVFGITALGVTQALAEPELGPGPAKLLGALAFAVGLVFLVVGRSELFTENFFDPVAAALADGTASAWLRLLRLWCFILMLNLVGGAVLVAVMSVEGALPAGAPEALTRVAEEVVGKTDAATLARAVVAGALLTHLSYMLHAVSSVRGRISVAFMAGFLVAVGPFDHVVVNALHLMFGMWLGEGIALGELAANIGLTTIGNLLGGVVLMTLTHTAQEIGSQQAP